MEATMKALTLAYKKVKNDLKWTHPMLCSKYGLTMPTLRRISKGKKGNKETDDFYFDVFVRIISDAYKNDLSNNGGARSKEFMIAFKDILFALCNVDW